MHERDKPHNRTNEGALSINAPKLDRRVRRTRDALGDALMALMREKPFDSITVQDVLDRAGVGRSTFYTHYRDKEDLFMSGADEFYKAVATHLAQSKDTSERVAMVGEFFAHVGEMQWLIKELTTSGRFHDHMELMRGHFARGIEQRLAELPRSRALPAAERTALAHAHAGALLSLLQWWLDHGMREPPAEIDKLFHRMVWGSVDSMNATPSNPK